MRREKKIEIRVCKTKDNRFTVDDFAALADERTRIIVMSTLESVSYTHLDVYKRQVTIRPVSPERASSY